VNGAPSVGEHRSPNICGSVNTSTDDLRVVMARPEPTFEDTVRVGRGVDRAGSVRDQPGPADHRGLAGGHHPLRRAVPGRRLGARSEVVRVARSGSVCRLRREERRGYGTSRALRHFAGRVSPSPVRRMKPEGGEPCGSTTRPPIRRPLTMPPGDLIITLVIRHQFCRVHPMPAPTDPPFTYS